MRPLALLAPVLLALVVALPAQGPRESTSAREVPAGEAALAELRRLASEAPESPDALADRTGAFRVPLRDRLDRRTIMDVYLPEKLRGAIVLLHGLGRDASELRDAGFRRLADEQGLALLAPAARSLPRDARNVDGRGPAGWLPEWWSYGDDGFAIAALDWLAARRRFDRDRVFLVGHSMGGFGTWNVGLRCADRFAGLVPISGGISRREFLSRGPDREARRVLGNAGLVPILAIHGDADPLVPARFDRRSRDAVAADAADFRYLEVEGGRHVLDLDADGALIEEIGTWIAARRRDPHPRRISFRVRRGDPGRAFWLEVRAWRTREASVTGRVGEDGVVHLTSSGVDELALHLDPVLFPPGKGLKVRLNGVTVHEGVIAPDPAAVRATWEQRRDPALVAWATLALRPE
ncbi:MAG: alpha/beta hydrolase [Planctomycetota bacterium]